ncbi:uncharacterized protein VP01_2732g1, partial [Puccinia sorghi]
YTSTPAICGNCGRRDLDNQLGIRLHPSTAFHPQTDGQYEIANEAIKQYLTHFINYHQGNWFQLLTNYGFNLSYSCVPSPEQYLPAVEERLKKLSEVKEELKECLQRSQESMKHQFDKQVRMNPDWKVGDKVWLNSRNISITRLFPKLDDQWLGPFPISKFISLN